MITIITKEAVIYELMPDGLISVQHLELNTVTERPVDTYCMSQELCSPCYQLEK